MGETGDGETTVATAPVTGFSHMQLNVADVAESVEWYCTVLGMDVMLERPDVTALQNRAARMVIVIGPAERLDVSASPVDHLAFAVPDGEALRAWAEHLTAVGIEHPGVIDELGKPSLQLLDPDGNAVELVAPAPR
jgi:glyoxylase I family protein